jgi:hypothetical protein
MSEEMERAEKIWQQVAARLKPAVMETVVRRDSGSIVLRFGSGEFKEGDAIKKI